MLLNETVVVRYGDVKITFQLHQLPFIFCLERPFLNGPNAKLLLLNGVEI